MRVFDHNPIKNQLTNTLPDSKTYVIGDVDNYFKNLISGHWICVDWKPSGSRMTTAQRLFYVEMDEGQTAINYLGFYIVYIDGPDLDHSSEFRVQRINSWDEWKLNREELEDFLVCGPYSVIRSRELNEIK